MRSWSTVVIPLRAWRCIGMEKAESGFLRLSDQLDPATGPHCAHIGTLMNRDIPIAIAGNKIDLESERKVSAEQANSMAQKFNMKYYDVSAKKDINIQQCMDEIFNQTVAHKFGQKDDNTRKSHVLKRGDAGGNDQAKEGCKC